MSGYVPSMVLLWGLYLEHRKEKLGNQFVADEAWQEFMQFIKNKQADAWDHALAHVSQLEADVGFMEHYKPHNPYREQETGYSWN